LTSSAPIANERSLREGTITRLSLSRPKYRTEPTQCLILAAGNGTRLKQVSSGLPKPLVPFRGKPILENVMLSAEQAGIDQFVIVVGYRSDLIRRWFDSSQWTGRVSVTWVENPDFHKQNGISALKARDQIHGNFLLLMADHLFEPETARALMAQPLGPGEVILAVDPNIDGVFDLEDATKVRREHNFIVDIGKEIAQHDALDTGMFLCSPALFDRLDSATRDGNCSLSDGMLNLARERKLRAFEIGGAHWQDLDTPEALAHAESVFDLDFFPEPVGESLAHV
jgi:choline kinase